MKLMYVKEKVRPRGTPFKPETKSLKGEFHFFIQELNGKL